MAPRASPILSWEILPTCLTVDETKITNGKVELAFTRFLSFRAKSRNLSMISSIQLLFDRLMSGFELQIE